MYCKDMCVYIYSLWIKNDDENTFMYIYGLYLGLAMSFL